MRLIRLASVRRKAGSTDQYDLAQRLQQGLPDSTYTKAEEFFSRQAQVNQPVMASNNNASRGFRAASSIEVQPPSDEETQIGQKRRRPVQEAIQDADFASKAPRVTTGLETPRQTPENDLLTVEEGIEGLSPQSIAVAALIGQRASYQLPAKSPLTPSKAEVTSANNRDQRLESSPVKEIVSDTPSTSWMSTPDLTEVSTARTETSIYTNGTLSGSTITTFSKPFPFRRGDSTKVLPESRIIDRRRARNEDMRRRYLQKRLEQQRAREGKSSRLSLAVKAEPSKSAPMPTFSARTPVSMASESATTGPSEPPASLRNLLNQLPKSS